MSSYKHARENPTPPVPLLNNVLSAVCDFIVPTRISVICCDHSNFLSILPDREGIISLTIITEDDIKSKFLFLKNSVENNYYKNWNEPIGQQNARSCGQPTAQDNT